MTSAADYIEDLQTNGRLVFTTDDAVKALGKSVVAVRAQLRRLKEKGRISDGHPGAQERVEGVADGFVAGGVMFEPRPASLGDVAEQK